MYDKRYNSPIRHVPPLSFPWSALFFMLLSMMSVSCLAEDFPTGYKELETYLEGQIASPPPKAHRKERMHALGQYKKDVRALLSSNPQNTSQLARLYLNIGIGNL